MRYSMQVKAPIRTHVRKVKGARNPICCECGYAWTEEEQKENISCVSNHMVEMHGYKRVGAQVFRSTPCVGCRKPGLYRVGAVAYCKEHLPLAQKKREWVYNEMNNNCGDDEEQRQAIERDRKRAFSHSQRAGHR